MKHIYGFVMLCLIVPYAKYSFGAPTYNSGALPYWCDEKVRETTGWKSGLQGGIYHYCGGLNHLNDYWKKKSPYERQYALERAIGEFNYMIVNNPGSQDPMLGEVYLNKAYALRLGGKKAEAIGALYKAIELNPRLTQAYLELATMLAKLKQEDKALKVVTQGLRYMPGTPSLERRYNTLGGKLPYPDPIQKPAEVVDAISVQDKASESSGSAPVVEKANEEKNKPLPPIENNVDQIGEGSNPWCRFCP